MPWLYHVAPVASWPLLHLPIQYGSQKSRQWHHQATELFFAATQMASSHFIHMSRYVKYPPVVKHSFFFHSPDEWWFTGSSPKTGFGSFGAAIPECQEIRISRLSELERSTIFKNGKPSINIPWLPWLCLITRGYIYIHYITTYYLWQCDLVSPETTCFSQET